MMKIYVDAGIDLSLERLKELNIGILYHSIIIDGEEKCSRIDLSHTEKLEYYTLVNEKIVKTSRPPLGEIKKLAEQKKLVFSQKILTYTMGNAITIEDTNGNRKLLKMRRDTKIDSVAALIDAYVAYKASEEAFD